MVDVCFSHLNLTQDLYILRYITFNATIPGRQKLPEHPLVQNIFAGYTYILLRRNVTETDIKTGNREPQLNIAMERSVIDFQVVKIHITTPTLAKVSEAVQNM